MTEYGRGRGSEPWHPEDPLYGDQGWDGQQSAPAPDLHDGRPQQYPRQHPQWDGRAGEPYQGQQYAQAPYPGQYGNQPYPDQQQYQGPPYPDQQSYPDPQYGWDGDHGPGQGYGPGQPGDPYAGHDQRQPADPYGYQQQQQQHPQQQYDDQRYGQQHPQHEQDPQRQQQYDRQQADPADGWQPEPVDGPGQAFFADQPDSAGAGPGRDSTGDFDDRDEHDDRDEDEYEDEYEDAPRRRGKERRGGKPGKRRSGTACLLVAVVLAGGVGVGGYFAYDFYQTHFGPAPDFAGKGTGTVQVEIPAGAPTGEMGRVLQKAGVVKSAQAFVDAAADNPEGQTIQPGVYSLKKGMSGAAALELMLDPVSRSALIIPEGMRNAQIYATIDKKLELKEGSTAKVAEAQAGKLGLPDWADDNEKIKDPLEGFLYPARYDAGEKADPEGILRQMVTRATAEYEKYDLAGEAEKLKLDSPLQLVAVASMVQAEGKTSEDFGKMARVIYNRLEPGNTETNGKIEFDSTFNYLKGQSEINIGIDEIRNHDDPYNTYFYRGLPPGPIGNPGAEALEAAMDPEQGDWYYFVSVDGVTTKFAETHEEHQKLVAEFNENQKNKS
ncbi:MAG TPA: endolytic transglycosylase MltG [Streptomyces sp.]|nr:endolytic transglycosylase MltG [Streptomyces sp.]